MLLYTRRLGDTHSVSIMGGSNSEDYTYKSNLMSREGVSQVIDWIKKSVLFEDLK